MPLGRSVSPGAGYTRSVAGVARNTGCRPAARPAGRTVRPASRATVQWRNPRATHHPSSRVRRRRRRHRRRPPAVRGTGPAAARSPAGHRRRVPAAARRVRDPGRPRPGPRRARRPGRQHPHPGQGRGGHRRRRKGPARAQALRGRRATTWSSATSAGSPARSGFTSPSTPPRRQRRCATASCASSCPRSPSGAAAVCW